MEPYNYNELAPGVISEIAYVFACDLPDLKQRPNKISTTTESISINWNEPTDNGGCSIQGYSVHIDDGDSGEYIEANEVNDVTVRLLPSLSTLEIRSLSSINLGKTFRILVRAYNYAGVSESPILGVVFASLPE